MSATPRVPYAAINMFSEFPPDAEDTELATFLTPLTGVAALPEEWQEVPTAIARVGYERRPTPVTWPELPVPMAALVEGDSDGVPVEIVEDEPTVEQCCLCGGPVHQGLCTGRKAP